VAVVFAGGYPNGGVDRMSRNLPPTFDDFSLQAKRQFLSEARNRQELMQYILEAVDSDMTANDHNVTNGFLIEIYLQVSELEE